MSQNEEQRQMALQVRDTRVFAFMNQLEKAEKFPAEIRKGVVSMLNEKIKYMMDWETSEMIASSELVPKDYIGKPNNVFLAIQTGRSLGLDPFQSVKHLYTINGRTSLFGDMMLALAKKHVDFIDIIETEGPYVDADPTHGKLPEYVECRVKIKEREDIVQRFTLEQAKKNPNYNNKYTPWMNGHAPRMMKFRARSFCLRDGFPDMLAGVYDEYEIQEIAEAKDITSQTTDLNKQSASDSLKDTLGEDEEATRPSSVEIQDKDGKVIKPEDPKPQEKPKNIDQIKGDFQRWLKEKAISKKQYQKFTDAGSSGEWDKVVKMHEKLAKKNPAKEEKPEEPTDGIDWSLPKTEDGLNTLYNLVWHKYPEKQGEIGEFFEKEQIDGRPEEFFQDFVDRLKKIVL